MAIVWKNYSRQAAIGRKRLSGLLGMSGIRCFYALLWMPVYWRAGFSKVRRGVR